MARCVVCGQGVFPIPVCEEHSDALDQDFQIYRVVVVSDVVLDWQIEIMKVFGVDTLVQRGGYYDLRANAWASREVARRFHFLSVEPGVEENLG